MKKRILSMLIVFTLSLSCVACGSGQAQAETGEIIDGVKILREYSIQTSDDNIKHVVIAENTNDKACDITAKCTAKSTVDMAEKCERSSVSAKSTTCLTFDFENKDISEYNTTFMCTDPKAEIESNDITITAEKSGDHGAKVYITNNSNKEIGSVTYDIFFFKNDGVVNWNMGIETDIQPGSTIEHETGSVKFGDDSKPITPIEFDDCEVYLSGFTMPYIR